MPALIGGCNETHSECAQSIHFVLTTKCQGAMGRQHDPLGGYGSIRLRVRKLSLAVGV
jgi:hypothetical protein